MSLELEQIIKQCLDGVFYALTDEGKIVKRLVDVDYMPNHHWRSNEAYKTSGARNGNHKPWTPELDAQLIQVRNSGLSWVGVGATIGRSPSNSAIRYKELCATLGMTPAPPANGPATRRARV